MANVVILPPSGQVDRGVEVAVGRVAAIAGELPLAQRLAVVAGLAP
jgi:hypothetical protein